MGTKILIILCTCTAACYRDQVPAVLGQQISPNEQHQPTLDLEGLHREIHDMAEYMRIANKNNALLLQHLATNNRPPPATLFPYVIKKLAALGDRVKANIKATKVLDGHSEIEHKLRFLGEKEALFRQNPIHLVELPKKKARKSEKMENHLAETTRRPDARIDPLLRRSEI